MGGSAIEGVIVLSGALFNLLSAGQRKEELTKGQQSGIVKLKDDTGLPPGRSGSLNIICTAAGWFIAKTVLKTRAIGLSTNVSTYRVKLVDEYKIYFNECKRKFNTSTANLSQTDNRRFTIESFIRPLTSPGGKIGKLIRFTIFDWRIDPATDKVVRGPAVDQFEIDTSVGECFRLGTPPLEQIKEEEKLAILVKKIENNPDLTKNEKLGQLKDYLATNCAGTVIVSNVRDLSIFVNGVSQSIYLIDLRAVIWVVENKDNSVKSIFGDIRGLTNVRITTGANRLADFNRGPLRAGNLSDSALIKSLSFYEMKNTTKGNKLAEFKMDLQAGSNANPTSSGLVSVTAQTTNTTRFDIKLIRSGIKAPTITNIFTNGFSFRIKEEKPIILKPPKPTGVFTPLELEVLTKLNLLCPNDELKKTFVSLEVLNEHVGDKFAEFRASFTKCPWIFGITEIKDRNGKSITGSDPRAFEKGTILDFVVVTNDIKRATLFKSTFHDGPFIQALAIGPGDKLKLKLPFSAISLGVAIIIIGIIAINY